MGVPEGVERVNLRGRGANIEYVPVPVLESFSTISRISLCNYLSGLCSPVSSISLIKSRYWYSSCLAAVIGASVLDGSECIFVGNTSSVFKEGDILCDSIGVEEGD